MEQLRLACLHPQMTQYWRGLANELQLAQVLFWGSRPLFRLRLALSMPAYARASMHEWECDMRLRWGTQHCGVQTGHSRAEIEMC